jgi:hypothetical protein
VDDCGLTALIGVVVAAAALTTPLPSTASVDPDSTPRLIVRTKPRQQLAFWG